MDLIKEKIQLEQKLFDIIQLTPEYLHLLDLKYITNRKPFDIAKECIKPDNTLDTVKLYIESKKHNVKINNDYSGIGLSFEDIYNQIRQLHNVLNIEMLIKNNILPNLQDNNYNEAVKNIISLQSKLESDSGIEDIEYIAKKAKKLIKNYIDNPDMLLTKLPTLDYYLRGIHKKQYFVIAGRPHMGKTTFALQIVYNFLMQGSKAIYFAFEQSSEMILAQLAGIAYKKSFFDLCDNEIDDFTVLYKNKLFIIDKPMNIFDMALSVKTIKAKNNISNVFIDYIGLIKPHNTQIKRNEQISEISREIKRLTSDDLTVFALAQINRMTENTRDRRPVLANIKDSGSLEEDADKILLLHREGYYKKNANKNRLEVILAKNRGVGITGTVLTEMINSRIVEIDKDFMDDTEDDYPF